MTTYSNYRHILFDADNTLFDFDAAEEGAITETMAHFGVEPSPEHKRLYHTINAHLWSLFDKGGISQEDLALQRFQFFLESLETEENAPEVRGDAQEWNRSYREALGSCSLLLPGAEDLCRRLSRRYTLSLITNGLSDVQRKRLAGSPVEKYFGERVFISGEMDCRKPERAYFDRVLEAIGCKKRKGQVLVVGDSLSSDILGAFNAQLDSVWLNRTGAKAYPIRPTYEVSGFAALERLLLPDAFEDLL